MEEFSPVEMENVISTPRKVELLMELKLRGFRSSEKRVQGKLTWIPEEKFLEHQINLQVQYIGLQYSQLLRNNLYKLIEILSLPNLIWQILTYKFIHKQFLQRF